MSAPDLGTAVRSAILADLEALEAHHYRRMEEHRRAGAWNDADREQRMAELVRGTIVTAQAAASRAIEAHGVVWPSAKNVPGSST